MNSLYSRWTVLRVLILTILALPLTDYLRGLSPPPPVYVLAVDGSQSMTRRYPGFAERVSNLWDEEPPPEGSTVSVGGDDRPQ